MFFKKRTGKSKSESAQSQGAAASAPTRTPGADFFGDDAGPKSEPTPKKSEPEPPGGPPTTTTARAISVIDLADLVSASGRAATGEMVQGWYAVGPRQGGRTAAELRASEGDTFLATASVRLLKPNATEHNSRFFFGALFLDKDGNVLKWWKGFEAPASGSATEISHESVAPAGAVSVRLGLNGTYDSSGNIGDYVVGFADARLRAV